MSSSMAHSSRPTSASHDIQPQQMPLRRLEIGDSNWSRPLALYHRLEVNPGTPVFVAEIWPDHTIAQRIEPGHTVLDVDGELVTIDLEERPFRRVQYGWQRHIWTERLSDTQPIDEPEMQQSVLSSEGPVDGARDRDGNVIPANAIINHMPTMITMATGPPRETHMMMDGLLEEEYRRRQQERQEQPQDRSAEQGSAPQHYIFQSTTVPNDLSDLDPPHPDLRLLMLARTFADRMLSSGQFTDASFRALWNDRQEIDEDIADLVSDFGCIRETLEEGQRLQDVWMPGGWPNVSEKAVRRARRVLGRSEAESDDETVEDLVYSSGEETPAEDTGGNCECQGGHEAGGQPYISNTTMRLRGGGRGGKDLHTTSARPAVDVATSDNAPRGRSTQSRTAHLRNPRNLTIDVEAANARRPRHRRSVSWADELGLADPYQAEFDRNRRGRFLRRNIGAQQERLPRSIRFEEVGRPVSHNRPAVRGRSQTDPGVTSAGASNMARHVVEVQDRQRRERAGERPAPAGIQYESRDENRGAGWTMLTRWLWR